MENSPADAPEYEYTVQLRMVDRRVHTDPVNGGHVERVGVSWSLTRSCGADDQRYHQSIVSSPEVFECIEDANRDALEKLSMLRCPLERPIDHAIRWMLGD